MIIYLFPLTDSQQMPENIRMRQIRKRTPDPAPVRIISNIDLPWDTALVVVVVVISQAVAKQFSTSQHPLVIIFSVEIEMIRNYQDM